MLISCFLQPYAATALVRLASRSGSYTSPVTHSLCINTADFLATATMARFFAFLPPRTIRLRPNGVNRCLDQSGPGCSAHSQPKNTAAFDRRTLVIDNCGLLSPSRPAAATVLGSQQYSDSYQNDVVIDGQSERQTGNRSAPGIWRISCVGAYSVLAICSIRLS